MAQHLLFVNKRYDTAKQVGKQEQKTNGAIVCEKLRWTRMIFPKNYRRFCDSGLFGKGLAIFGDIRHRSKIN
jgi:hypothetical protein